jgi:hypothetical protein
MSVILKEKFFGTIHEPESPLTKIPTLKLLPIFISLILI